MDEMQYAVQMNQTPNTDEAEPSIAQTLSQMINSPANKAPTLDQVMNIIRGFGQAGESLGRGVVAGIPGMVGDVNQLAQQYVTPQLPTQVQNVLGNLPAAPTTQDYLNQIPRYSNQFGDQTANNFMEGLGTALSPDALTAVAPAARFLGNAAGERIMAGQSLIPGVPADLVNPQILSAVKQKGGNWTEQGLRDLELLKKPVNTYTETPQVLEQTGLTEKQLADLPFEKRRELFQPYLTPENKSQQAVNDWIDTKLKNYVRNEMATPTDPVRELHEQGISHIPDIHREGEINWKKEIGENARRQAGFPEKGFGKSPEAKDWEYRSDTALNSMKLNRYADNFPSRMKSNPGLEKALEREPESRIYEVTPYTTGNLGFNHLVDELKNSISPSSDLPAHLKLKPEALDRVTVPQAVKHVDKINKWRAEQMANAAKESLKDFPVVHEGKTGNIHELKMPDIPLELPEGHKVIDAGDGLYAIGDSSGKELEHSVAAKSPEGVIYKHNMNLARNKLDKALKNEGEQMGHCVGGYTDSVASGKTRIFSLRDPKGGAHVTIEVRPHVESDYNPRNIPDEVKANIDKYAKDETIKAGYREGSEPYWNHYTGVQIQEGSKYLKENPKVTNYVEQIKGKGNGAVAEKYRKDIQDFLNSQHHNIEIANDLHNVDLVDTSKNISKQYAPFIQKQLEEGKLPRFISQKELEEAAEKGYQDLRNNHQYKTDQGWENMGQFMDRMFPDESTKKYAVGELIKSPNLRKTPSVKEQKMLQGFYRGYAGEPTAEGTVFASPQRAVAEYYAKKRAAQTGLTPHAEMVLADPFAGVKYGHATAGTGANPNLITQARKLTPEQIAARTQLYKKGGHVKMAAGGQPLTPYEQFKIDNAERIRQGQEINENRNKYDPYKGSDKPVETPKMNRGVSGGAGFTPGTMNPFNPDSPLNHKNGGKISVDEMRYELLRNK
jgi:hypothetical protein